MIRLFHSAGGAVIDLAAAEHGVARDDGPSRTADIAERPHYADQYRPRPEPG